MIRIKKGLDLPIKGKPEPVVEESRTSSRVAVLGDDYPGIRPVMAVRESDAVAKGQVLFRDKNWPEVSVTAPGNGRIQAIHRGERRQLRSVVIEITGTEEIVFKSYSPDELAKLTAGQIRAQLLESGLWPALRARPFNKIADPNRSPHSIFITAMDSNPLAPAIDRILVGQERLIEQGVRLLSRLTSGKLFLCKAPETRWPEMTVENMVVTEFAGPHPSGNVGTHIHFLDPVHRGKTVWHIGIQDVIAIGKLFTTGRYDVDRIVSLAGPSVKRPRMLKTRLGAALDELTEGELVTGEQRIISGSVLSGFQARNETGFLGRYHQQVSVIPEDRRREFLGWLNPGLNRFSLKRTVISRFIPGRLCDFTTSTNGEVRAIIPAGNFERIMPLDIMPLFLIRALAVEDVEEAENLGCLELDEEDLALCAYVCPSKQEFGPMLRRALALIEEEIYG
ncbi:MAG: Na(+)-translocating NADH-quinone reductase subunit A [Gammaproteobacteria bacterium]